MAYFASTSRPNGSDTLTVLYSPPCAATNASVLPSPPSAISWGCIFAPKKCFLADIVSILTASDEDNEPLNLSGASTKLSFLSHRLFSFIDLLLSAYTNSPFVTAPICGKAPNSFLSLFLPQNGVSSSKNNAKPESASILLRKRLA